MNQDVEKTAVYAGLIGTGALIGYGAYANARDKAARAYVLEQRTRAREKKRQQKEARQLEKQQKAIQERVNRGSRSPKTTRIPSPQTTSFVDTRPPLSDSLIAEAMEEYAIREHNQAVRSGQAEQDIRRIWGEVDEATSLNVPGKKKVNRAKNKQEIKQLKDDIFNKGKTVLKVGGKIRIK